ncbi:MAG: hypothetical protein EP330_06075 [Deltaproteobacteria bacterium]|nr:MAG: hypothetical protein EP330_06075 [Deltaproteobacteria bacterium]
MRHTTLAMLLTTLAATGCEREYNYVDLAGEDGVLRFNLQFTNPEQVDLDLHVVAPDGSEIFYAEPSAAGGQLDVDCFCGEGNCPQGPNENIYWDYAGEAPPGTYVARIEYYGTCDGSTTAESEFTLRVLQSGDIVAEYVGVLGYLGFAEYTHVELAP